MKKVRSNLLIATTNPGKLVEVALILGGLPFELKTLADFDNVVVVEETGKTFAENAALKAEGYASQMGLYTIADDSGLEVDALDGAPGVLSARYAGERASDEERISFLLSNLAHVPEHRRTARFVSSVALAGADGRLIHAARGVCEGTILFQPRGAGGFGYDPVFVPEGYDRTLAELSPGVKNGISHRARALSATYHFLLAVGA
jgi:XTP/dITP diphosphohydrolase